jgi:class 3 adenylate cyclase
MVREFLTGLGSPPANPDRFRIAAWIRLGLAVPLILVPTGLEGYRAIDASAHPEVMRATLLVWGAHLALVVLLNVALLASWRAGDPRGAARRLTYASITLELVGNQVAAYTAGTLISPSALFIVVLIAIYRVFFDYRLGLYTLILGGALLATTVALELFGVLPVHPLHATAAIHPLYAEASRTILVGQGVLVGLVLAFAAVNYGVNQSVKLHRYITESVLRRYLPTSMVDLAARGELRLDAPPEKRQVTVMFADIVGFTRLCETLDADALGRVVNGYLSRIADLAHAHGATIDKFVGDAVMVVFGAPDPLPGPEQARRSVALARRIQRDVGAIDGVAVSTRIGINTGEAVVGNFGSEVRSDFTVIGPIVNVAARLEAASRPGRILLGEETARLLGDAAALEEAGALRLKGVSEPVKAYFLAEPSAAEV